MNLFRKLFRKKELGSYGPYGCFDIWSDSSCRSGHFWAYSNEVNEKWLTEHLINLFKKVRKDYNWTEEEYKEQFYCNLRNNNVLDYYEEHYGIKAQRKKKLKKINGKGIL
jgi:hypothetical protein